MLRQAILGFLNYGPMFGYELKRFMDGSVGHFWHAKLSQIYTTLKALETEGCVSSNVEARDDGPDRRRYTLTAKGRDELGAWLKTPLSSPTPQKDAFLLKLFFSARADRKAVLAQLHLELARHESAIAVLREQAPRLIAEGAARDPALAADARFWEATRRFGEIYEEGYLRWLRETIQTFEETP